LRIAGNRLPRKQQAGGADKIRSDVVTMGAKEFLNFSHVGFLFQKSMTLFAMRHPARALCGGEQLPNRSSMRSMQDFSRSQPVFNGAQNS